MPIIRRYGNSGTQRASPEVALIVSTYQRPRHLRLSLASIALQQELGGKLELVVTDDGSTDETFEIVERFAATVEFPVTLTTHRHGTFQLAQCRNEGVAASAAPYLIFTDGDLILPPDFVQQHLRQRRTRTALTGECYRLAEDACADLDEAAVRSEAYRKLVSPEESLRVRKASRRARWHMLVRHPDRPRLVGWDVGLWRNDYERVNGYDENFRGWGCEDDDLTHRLRSAGVRTRWINRWTCAYHVWHPRDATAPAVWQQGANVAYYQREHRPSRCLNGLYKLGPAAELDDRDASAPFPSDGVAAIPFHPTQVAMANERQGVA
jgi:glycosyltransferase involved in cell wall biosynthesis